jgi:hypothetical protein
MGTESADLGVGAEYPVVCGAVEGARAGPAVSLPGRPRRCDKAFADAVGPRDSGMSQAPAVGAPEGPAKVEWANPSCTAGQFRLFGLVGTRADRGRSVAQDRATADNERAIPFFIHQGDIP